MSTAGYLQDAKNQQKRLAETITAKGIAAKATEKYKDLVDKVAQIENLKGEERTLENFTNVLSEPKSIVQLEYPEPKNLFSLANRTWADFGATPNTTVRNINKDNFYFQVSSNNYVNNSKTGYEIVNGNTIKITGVQHAYGLGVPFHLIAGQQYTISCIRDNEKSRIRVSYYDVNGNYLSEFIDLPGSFTVPENAYWTMILFIAYNPVGASSGELTFSNIQLELGTTATPYEPYPAPKTLNAKLGSKNLWQNTNTTFPTKLSYDSATQTYTMGAGTAGYNFVAHTLTNPIPVGTTVTISIMFQSGKGRGVAIGGYHRTGGTSWQGYINVPFNVDMTGQTLTVTFTTTETVEEFMVFHNTGDNIEDPFIFQVQYELGSIATPYTPFISDFSTVTVTRYGVTETDRPQTYIPTVTGEVTGITNLYPTTTLLTDNAGVLFEQVTGGFYKEILPSTDKNGITKVYQPSVDSTIDSNIKPENIKKGITILGVTGTYEPTA